MKTGRCLPAYQEAVVAYRELRSIHERPLSPWEIGVKVAFLFTGLLSAFAYIKATKMADAFDQFQILLQEKVDPMVHDLTLEGDDPAWTMLDTFKAIDVAGRTTGSLAANVDNEGTAGYECSWRIMVQRGGRISGGSFSGPTPTAMGTDDTLIAGQASDAYYLDPAYTPVRSYIGIKMLSSGCLGH